MESWDWVVQCVSFGKQVWHIFFSFGIHSQLRCVQSALSHGVWCASASREKRKRDDNFSLFVDFILLFFRSVWFRLVS